VKPTLAIMCGLVFASVLLVAASAGQQSGQSTDKKAPTPSAPVMQVATPGPEMERLKFLRGKWKYTEIYIKTSSFSNGGTGKGTYVAAAGRGRFSQIADFQGVSPEGDIAGHEVITWDPSEGVYKSYVFANNFSGCFTKKGHWEGNKLVFAGEFAYAGMTIHFYDETAANADGSVPIVEKSSTGDAPLELTLTTTAVRE
jgi:hypothetical protein